MKTYQKLFSILSTGLVGLQAMAAAPTIDGYHVQSYLRLSNNSPVSATSADFVFAVFKGSTCIWAKRYSSVAISTGILNQKISGAGTNIASIVNASATPGECVANFSGTILDATLLNTGAASTLSIRVYAETTIDTYKPIWDIPLNSAPTAMVADVANSATTATSASDLAAAAKVTTSAGSSDNGKFPVLSGNGQIDNSMINQTGLTIANTQVTGLGTVATLNTGTAAGNVPVLNGSGKLVGTIMPTYTANRIMTSDGTGTLTAGYSATNSSAGAADSGKVPLLNGSGKISSTMIDLDPTNLTAVVSVAKGGTGQSSLPANGLLVGNGTTGVNNLAPGANGTVLMSNGTTWSATLPNSANIVDMTSTQASIGGDKTFTGAAQFTNATATVLDNGIKVKSAGAGSTTLNHYEEGTFTPAYTGATTPGSCTYTVQTGNFTRIGKIVTFSTILTWSACPTPPVGAVRITGLPYSSNTTAGLPQMVQVAPTNYTGVAATYYGRIQPNTNYIEVWTATVVATPVQAKLSTIDTAATLLISGSYVVQ